MAVARALGEERLSPWHNLIPDTSVFVAQMQMYCTYTRDRKSVSLLKNMLPITCYDYSYYCYYY